MGGRLAGNVPLASLLVRFVRIALAITLRDIARRAGVGLGTLYGHFPTREALLEALLRKSFDELTAKAGKLAKGFALDIPLNPNGCSNLTLQREQNSRCNVHNGLETSRSPEEALMSCGRFTEMHPLAFLDPGAIFRTWPSVPAGLRPLVERLHLHPLPRRTQPRVAALDRARAKTFSRNGIFG